MASPSLMAALETPTLSNEEFLCLAHLYIQARLSHPLEAERRFAPDLERLTDAQIVRMTDLLEGADAVRTAPIPSPAEAPSYAWVPWAFAVILALALGYAWAWGSAMHYADLVIRGYRNP